MKLLCLNYEYPPLGGGGAVASQGLAEALAAAGNEVDVVTSGMKHLALDETINGVDVHRVKCLRRHEHYTNTLELLTQVYPAYRRAVDLVRNYRFDLNHTHFIYPTGLVSYLLKKRTGLPYVITVHGSDVPGYNPDRFQLEHKLTHPIWQAIIANSSGLICPSDFIKSLVRRCTDKPISIIPNGINVTNKHCCAEKRNRILVVSRIFKRKGIQYLLDAVRTLETDWEIFVVGDGPYLQELRKLTDGIQAKVHFMGYLRGEQLTELYRSSKIFVFPSIQENFPVVLLEAMEAGCAIVTTDIEGCKEVIGDAGIVTAPSNVEQIKDALTRLMSCEQKIGELSQRSLRRIQEFDWATIANKYEKAFVQALQ